MYPLQYFLVEAAGLNNDRTPPGIRGTEILLRLLAACSFNTLLNEAQSNMIRCNFVCRNASRDILGRRHLVYLALAVIGTQRCPPHHVLRHNLGLLELVACHGWRFKSPKKRWDLRHGKWRGVCKLLFD